jgi:hypothetical protein
VGLARGAAGVGGHLPDLAAVVVDAGAFGSPGDLGEQVRLAGQERRSLRGVDGVAAAAVAGRAAAHRGEMVQEVGDVAGGDPVVVVGVVGVVVHGCSTGRVAGGEIGSTGADMVEKGSGDDRLTGREHTGATSSDRTRNRA